MARVVSCDQNLSIVVPSKTSSGDKAYGQHMFLKSWRFGGSWLFFSCLYFLSPLLEIHVRLAKNQGCPLIYFVFQLGSSLFWLVFLRFGLFLIFFLISSFYIFFLYIKYDTHFYYCCFYLLSFFLFFFLLIWSLIILFHFFFSRWSTYCFNYFFILFFLSISPSTFYFICFFHSILIPILLIVFFLFCFFFHFVPQHFILFVSYPNLFFWLSLLLFFSLVFILD
jgi:hypothetical protein